MNQTDVNQHSKPTGKRQIVVNHAANFMNALGIQAHSIEAAIQQNLCTLAEWCSYLHDRSLPERAALPTYLNQQHDTKTMNLRTRATLHTFLENPNGVSTFDLTVILKLDDPTITQPQVNGLLGNLVSRGYIEQCGFKTHRITFAGISAYQMAQQAGA
jgi:hypothetical protein